MADKNAPAPDPSKLKLEDVRLSFPDIWEPKSVNNSAPKYSAHFLIDKKEQADLIKLLRATIYTAAKEHFGEKTDELFKKKKIAVCLHDGSEKDDMAGYGEDVMYLSSSSAKRPLVIDRDRSPLTKDDRRPYGGCQVNAIVRIWVQDNEFGKRVNCELLGVQFFKDGEPFGAAPISPDEFEDLGGEGQKKAASSGKTAADDDEIPF